MQAIQQFCEQFQKNNDTSDVRRKSIISANKSAKDFLPE